MRTLHIKGLSHDSWLLPKLARDYLKNDPLWHYVYWQDFWTHKAFIEGKNIILRISNEKVLREVKNFLDNTPEIMYEEYDFPYPRGKFQLGLKRLSWEARNLEYCLPMLHALSIARLHFGSKKRFLRFISHYLHIAFNIAGFDHSEELEYYTFRAAKTAFLVRKMYQDKKGKWKK